MMKLAIMASCIEAQPHARAGTRPADPTSQRSPQRVAELLVGHQFVFSLIVVVFAPATLSNCYYKGEAQEGTHLSKVLKRQQVVSQVGSSFAMTFDIALSSMRAGLTKYAKKAMIRKLERVHNSPEDACASSSWPQRALSCGIVPLPLDQG